MYTSKELITRAQQLRVSGDVETAGMIEHLNQLQTSYIPQLIEIMKDKGFYWETNSNFPHMVKYKPKAPPCVHKV